MHCLFSVCCFVFLTVCRLFIDVFVHLLIHVMFFLHFFGFLGGVLQAREPLFIAEIIIYAVVYSEDVCSCRSRLVIFLPNGLLGIVDSSATAAVARLVSRHVLVKRTYDQC